MRLEAWDEAVAVLDAFREAHPDHELHGEATKQLANLHREQGELERAAIEYERIADEDEEARREALLVAGELYAEAEVPERAIAVYRDYVEHYPEPLEIAVETRFKIAALHDASWATAESRLVQLRWIVDDRPYAAGAGTHQPHPPSRGPLGARAHRGAPRPFRRSPAPAALRAESGGEAAVDGRWRSRLSGASSTTRSAR